MARASAGVDSMEKGMMAEIHVMDADGANQRQITKVGP